MSTCHASGSLDRRCLRLHVTYDLLKSVKERKEHVSWKVGSPVLTEPLSNGLKGDRTLSLSLSPTHQGKSKWSRSRKLRPVPSIGPLCRLECAALIPSPRRFTTRPTFQRAGGRRKVPGWSAPTSPLKAQKLHTLR